MAGISRYAKTQHEGTSASQQHFSTDSSIDRPPLTDITQRSFNLLNLLGRSCRSVAPSSFHEELSTVPPKALYPQETVELQEVNPVVKKDPLLIAASNGSAQRFLSILGMERIVKDPETGVTYQAYNYPAPSKWTALHFTAGKSNTPIKEQAEKCRQLLRRTTALTPDINGFTPLHIAAHFGNPLVAFELLSAVRTFFQNTGGQTPLHLITPETMTENNIYICAMLLLSKHPMHLKDEDNNTPLESVERKIEFIETRLLELHEEETSIPKFGVTEKQKKEISSRNKAVFDQITKNETLLKNLKTVRNMLINWEKASDRLKNEYIPEWRKILTENHKNLRKWQKYFETRAIIQAYERYIKNNPALEIEKPKEVIEGMPTKPEEFPQDIPLVIESFITTFTQAVFPTGDVQQVELTERLTDVSGSALPLGEQEDDPEEGPADPVQTALGEFELGGKV